MRPIMAPGDAPLNHQPRVFWLTGLSGAGKSTLAQMGAESLRARGLPVVVLDGDVLRRGLCADLGFSLADRNENVRRVGELARLFWEQGFIVLVALVSPLSGAREAVQQHFAKGDFHEIYCDCPLAVCQARDPKGLYAQVARGERAEFTGISSPYEVPLNPSLTLSTGTESVGQSAHRFTRFLFEHLGPQR